MSQLDLQLALDRFGVRNDLIDALGDMTNQFLDFRSALIRRRGYRAKKFHHIGSVVDCRTRHIGNGVALAAQPRRNLAQLIGLRAHCSPALNEWMKMAKMEMK